MLFIAALGISGLATGQNGTISTAALGIRGLAIGHRTISTAALGIRGLATGHRNISRNSGASPHSVTLALVNPHTLTLTLTLDRF